jgi:GDP-L-fucose synthase
MYAADLAEAIFLAAKDLETLPDLMNLGVGEDHSINDYYTTVANVIGWSGRFTHDLSKPVGMQRKLSDTSRQVAWGWSPKTSLETGVKKAYSYYLKGSNS